MWHHHRTSNFTRTSVHSLGSPTNSKIYCKSGWNEVYAHAYATYVVSAYMRWDWQTDCTCCVIEDLRCHAGKCMNRVLTTHTAKNIMCIYRTYMQLINVQTFACALNIARMKLCYMMIQVDCVYEKLVNILKINKKKSLAFFVRGKVRMRARLIT